VRTLPALGLLVGLSACANVPAQMPAAASRQHVAAVAACEAFFGTAARPGLTHRAAVLMRAGTLRGEPAARFMTAARALAVPCADPAMLASASDASVASLVQQLDSATALLGQPRS
jgi:hypothetical protein